MPLPSPVMVPRDVQILTPDMGACHLIWQMGLYRCDGVKDLEIKDYPGFFTWAQDNHKGPSEKEAGI